MFGHNRVDALGADGHGRILVVVHEVGLDRRRQTAHLTLGARDSRASPMRVKSLGGNEQRQDQDDADHDGEFDQRIAVGRGALGLVGGCLHAMAPG